MKVLSKAARPLKAESEISLARVKLDLSPAARPVKPLQEERQKPVRWLPRCFHSKINATSGLWRFYSFGRLLELMENIETQGRERSVL